ncbi:MAG: response regulator [Defluviitaleaceae bacterium]|nr:response regulator [Defluviitaleaceae bacterium]
MMEENVFDIRFLCFMPEIDLSSVIDAKDDMETLSANLQAFADKAPGFISFMKDPMNHRDANLFAAGVSVLKRVLLQIGCKRLMMEVAQLETAVRNRSVETRNSLIPKLSADLEKLFRQIVFTPRAHSAEETITGTLEAANTAEALRKKVIMVIDDSTLYLHAVEHTLDAWFDVYTLSKPENYEDILNKVIVDLFILDVEMPVMDGYQVMDALRAHPAYEETPIVFLTGHATPENLKLAKSKNINGFVRKPFNEDVLVDCVVKAIAKAKPRVFAP